METLSNTLHNKHIDHSTYGKAFKRIDSEFLSNLLTFTYVIIDNLLNQPSNKLYMANSTGVSINRLYKECIHRGKRTKRLVHDKLHVLASYYPEQGFIPIISARWGGGYSSDSANLLEMVKQIDSLDNEYLLADGGYDCCELFEYLLQHNITPIVKTKEFKWNRSESFGFADLQNLEEVLSSYHISKVRKTIKEMFNKDWYKLRGVVESIFGGLETKNRLKLDDRLADSRCKSTIATAIVHNILTLMRVLVFPSDSEGNEQIRRICVINL